MLERKLTEAMHIADTMPGEMEDLVSGFKHQDEFREDINEGQWREAVSIWENDSDGNRDPYSASKYCKHNSVIRWGSNVLVVIFLPRFAFRLIN